MNKKANVMRVNLWLFLLLFLLPIDAVQAAAIRLDNVIVHFENGKRAKKDIEVTNTSQETAYVEVTVYEVRDPGGENEETRVITDPKEIQLLVSPNKTIIPPNGRSFLRLVNLSTPKEKERIYRLKVAPVEGEGQANETGIRVLIAYGVLVIVEPEKPEPLLEYSKDGLVVTFKNTGNSNVLLSNGMVCKKEQPESEEGEKETEVKQESCEKLQSKRMYGGNTWELTIPFDGEVSFNKVTRLENEKLIIK